MFYVETNGALVYFIHLLYFRNRRAYSSTLFFQVVIMNTSYLLLLGIMHLIITLKIIHTQKILMSFDSHKKSLVLHVGTMVMVVVILEVV